MKPKNIILWAAITIILTSSLLDAMLLNDPFHIYLFRTTVEVLVFIMGMAYSKPIHSLLKSPKVV